MTSDANVRKENFASLVPVVARRLFLPSHYRRLFHQLDPHNTSTLERYSKFQNVTQEKLKHLMLSSAKFRSFCP